MKKKWCHRGHDLMVVGFITTYMQSVPIIMLLMLWAHDEVYLIQHYVIKFVSYLRKVSGFLWVLRFPPPIKLTTMIQVVVNPTIIRSRQRRPPNQFNLQYMFSLFALIYVCLDIILTWRRSFALQANERGSQNVLWVLTWVGGYKYFIPSKRREIKFNNIREPMLKLKTHSGQYMFSLFALIYVCLDIILTWRRSFALQANERYIDWV
jgi:hypothetical protein